MAGDLEALKKGSLPTAIPLAVKTPPPLATTPPIASTPAPKAPATVEKKEPTVPVVVPQIKPSFPKLEGFKTETPVSKPLEITKAETPTPKPIVKPLTPPPPLSPPRPQPFETPIKNPIMPLGPSSQNKIQPPPPDLPTVPTLPPRPAMPPPRPITPPPPARPSGPPSLPPLPPWPTINSGKTAPPLPSPSPTRPMSPPSLPPLPPLPSKPTLAGTGSKPRGKMILIGAVAVVVLVFIMGEIWYFFLREKPVVPSSVSQQEILPPPQELQPLLPPIEEVTSLEVPVAENLTPEVPTPPLQPAAGLLTYNATSVIDLAELKTSAGDVAAGDGFTKLIIRTGSKTSPEGEADSSEIDTIDGLVKHLKIKMPLSIKNQSTNIFDVFAFGGNSFDQDICEKAKNTAASCYGPRLGLALEVTDPIKTKSALKTWENTMVADLKPLVLAKVGPAATTAFQTGTYQNQTIRYKNLPLNTITIEYALVDNVLIITTSKNSMLKAIDSLKTKDNGREE